MEMETLHVVSYFFDGRQTNEMNFTLGDVLERKDATMPAEKGSGYRTASNVSVLMGETILIKVCGERLFRVQSPVV